MQPNYSLVVNNLKEDTTYRNARFASMNNDNIGMPFPAFREYAGRFTQWQPTALSMSTISKQMNLPTDTTALRNGLTNNAIGIGNNSLDNWVYTTQTLANPSFDTMYCTNNDDCKQFGPTFSCNSNFQSWNDVYGNQQGSVCNETKYPELDSGTYTRKTLQEGGIGKQCQTDNDCGSGYRCNNETDIFGKNIQQTGYCSQTYDCGDGITRFLGYPYGSSVPIAPAKTQNNNGQGYNTLNECNKNANAQQNCVQLNSKYYATYPGYCPTAPTLRKDGAQGALLNSGESEILAGFQIPAYGTNMGSSMGGLKQSMMNLNPAKKTSGMSEPFKYEMMINPRPK